MSSVYRRGTDEDACRGCGSLHSSDELSNFGPERRDNTHQNDITAAGHSLRWRGVAKSAYLYGCECVCVCVCLCIYVCLCVCIIRVFIYMYVCDVCVCMIRVLISTDVSGCLL